MASAVAIGGGVIGQAATTQRVTATLECQPAFVKPPARVGCTLTVTNNGGNNVVKTMVTDTATGGTFLSTSSSRCTGVGTSTLTCDIGKLTAAGTPGATFTETHELDIPSSSTSLSQLVTGRFSTNPNNRGSDTIPPITVNTPFNNSGDVDGTFATAADSVQTDPLTATNSYTAEMTVAGTGFASGLTINDGQAAGANNPNCPATGCFDDKILIISITPLTGAPFPDSYTATWTISGDVVDRGTRPVEIEIRHNGELMAPCDSTGSCVRDGYPSVDPATNEVTVIVDGPGAGNGGFGTG